MWTEYATIIEVNRAIPIRHMIKYANGIYEKRKQSNLVVFVLKIGLIIQCAYLAANMAFKRCRNCCYALMFSHLFFILFRGSNTWRFYPSINGWVFFSFGDKRIMNKVFFSFMLLFAIFWLKIFFFVNELWLINLFVNFLIQIDEYHVKGLYANLKYHQHHHGSITMIYFVWFYFIVHIV